MPATFYSEYVREYCRANSVAMVIMIYCTMLCCFLFLYYGVHYFLSDNISVWRDGDELTEQEDLKQMQKTNTRSGKCLSKSPLTPLTCIVVLLLHWEYLYSVVTDSIFVAMVTMICYVTDKVFHEDLKNDIPHVCPPTPPHTYTYQKTKLLNSQGEDLEDGTFPPLINRTLSTSLPSNSQQYIPN